MRFGNSLHQRAMTKNFNVDQIFFSCNDYIYIYIYKERERERERERINPSPSNWLFNCYESSQ